MTYSCVNKINLIYPIKLNIYRYSSIAQSVERMTVNHDVTGSSPVRGAKKKKTIVDGLFLFDFPCYGEDQFGFADMATRVKRGSTRRVFEPLNSP